MVAHPFTRRKHVTRSSRQTASACDTLHKDLALGSALSYVGCAVDWRGKSLAARPHLPVTASTGIPRTRE
eukprot:3341350-Pyramimonas_sp.AAC.1